MSSGLKLYLVVAAALSGFCFRMGESYVSAQPPPCPNYACKDVYAWWTNGNPGGNQCSAVSGLGDPKTHTTHANPGIFATSSNGQMPIITTTNPIDRLTYSTHNPTCGKNAQGQWQTPQEVVPTGVLTATHPINQSYCTPKAPGGGEED